MEKKIVTISREFCAGAHAVGNAVAEALGVPCYDKKLVKQIAEESGFAPKFVEERGEHAPGKSAFSYAFAPQGVPGIMNGLSTDDYLWNAQCNVILQLADEGPCVIVGRNADYILKDREDVLHVFLMADTAYRAKNLIELYGSSDKSPESRLQEKDKRRRLNYQHYTGRTWGMSQNYDLCLSTSVMGEELCAKMILEAMKQCK